MKLAGVLNINKKNGPTSHDIVAAVRRFLPRKTKVGHAGTLDPMAEGVLPVCLGAATKLFPYLLGCRKTYRAVMLFGRVTDTLDITGNLLEEKEAGETTLDAAQAILDTFLGESEQTPPMFSALKVGGARLHELARSGVEVERASRPIEIYRIEAVKMEGPQLTFEVTCSRGTYIRSLCHDIGAHHGVGGCLQALTRTELGPFCIEDAISIEAAEDYAAAGRLGEVLLSPAEALGHIPALGVRPEAEGRLLNGAPLGEGDLASESPPPAEGLVRLLSREGSLLAVGKMIPPEKRRGQKTCVAPEKLFSG